FQRECLNELWRATLGLVAVEVVRRVLARDLDVFLILRARQVSVEVIERAFHAKPPKLAVMRGEGGVELRRRRIDAIRLAPALAVLRRLIGGLPRANLSFLELSLDEPAVRRFLRRFARN